MQLPRAALSPSHHTRQNDELFPLIEGGVGQHQKQRGPRLGRDAVEEESKDSNIDESSSGVGGFSGGFNGDTTTPTSLFLLFARKSLMNLHKVIGNFAPHWSARSLMRDFPDRAVQ